MTHYASQLAHATGIWHFAFSHAGLTGVSNRPFPSHKHALTTAQQALAENHAQALNAMLDGHTQAYTLPLDIVGGTVFQRAVWKQIAATPYGETTSYAAIARSLGKPGAVRAVGTACGANPVAIAIPCHRVLRSNGELGGYAFGLELKKTLLNFEARRSQPSLDKRVAA